MYPENQTDFFQTWLMTGITRLYILTSVWITFIFIQGHNYMRNKKKKKKNPFSCYFLGDFAVSLDEIQYVATTFLEVYAKYILHK